MYKLVIFVPEQHAELLKQALFDAGAGRVGGYDYCCWQTLGEGQFRPLAGSTPFLGSAGQLEKITEYRLEMVLADEVVETVIEAVYRAHPYEEPAYDCWRLVDFGRLKPAD